MDQRTRKPMTMHKALYSREDVDRLNVSKKEEDNPPAFKITLIHRYNDKKTA